MSRSCARASVICFFFQKTIELSTRFPSGPTADGDLLFIFSSNILDFRRSLSSYLKFDLWQTKTRPDFIASRAASRPENLVPLTLKTAFLMWNWCQRSIFPSPVINNRQICLRFSLNIVNWVEWLWNASDSFVICFCGPESAQRSKEFLSFWLYWPIKTLH